MSDSPKRKMNDLQALRRMLSYLHGLKFAVVLMLLCIFGEALFMVGVLSVIKPMTDLMFTGRLVDRPVVSKLSPFVLSSPVACDDGAVVGVIGVGGGEDRQRLNDLRAFFSRHVEGDARELVLDLTRVEGIGPEGWSALMLGCALVDATTNTRLLVGVPADISVPASMAVDASGRCELLTTGSALWNAMAARVFADVPVPQTAAGRALQSADSLKAKAYAFAAPHIEAVEKYSRGSLMVVMSVLLAFMLVCALAVTAFGFGLSYLSSILARIVSLRMQEDLFRKTLRMDIAYFARKRDAHLFSIVMGDALVVTDTMEIIFTGLVRTPITLGTLLVAMVVISPKLTLFCLTVLPFMGVMIYILGKMIRRYGHRLRERAADQTVVVQEAYTGIRVVKAFNTEVREQDRFEQLNVRMMTIYRKVCVATEGGERAIRLLGFVTVGLMIYFGGYIVLGTGELSASEFTMFAALLSQVFRPLQAISKTNSRLQRGLASADRIYDVLDAEAAIVDAPGAIALPTIERAIVFENMSFRYDGADNDTLCNINLTVPCGRKIAIVGETGSGKSTLVNLLPRFFDPTVGRVSIDGHDLRDVTQESLREQIALITQEVILFDDTVANNIAYGTRDLTREQIEAAARQANAYQFITERMDQGFDTLVGTRGGRLSGGERQRIAIARAIVKDAPILILDEATSALDAETESLIQEALDHVMKGRTVFVIAHRLSTIRNCDIIYVMDKGEFVEAGTHDELLAANGRYARYYNIQFGLPTNGEAPATE